MGNKLTFKPRNCEALGRIRWCMRDGEETLWYHLYRDRNEIGTKADFKLKKITKDAWIRSNLILVSKMSYDVLSQDIYKMRRVSMNQDNTFLFECCLCNTFYTAYFCPILWWVLFWIVTKYCFTYGWIYENDVN